MGGRGRPLRRDLPPGQPGRRDGGAPRPRCRGGRRRLRDPRAAPAGPRAPRRTARHGRGQLGLGPGAAGVLRSRGALPRRGPQPRVRRRGQPRPRRPAGPDGGRPARSTRTPWSVPTTSTACTAPCSPTRRWPRWARPGRRDGHADPGGLAVPHAVAHLGEAVGLGRVVGDRADFAIGSVLLLRSEALAQVGGFDERLLPLRGGDRLGLPRRAARVAPRRGALGDRDPRGRRRRAATRHAREAHFHGIAGALPAQALRRRRVAGGPGRAARRVGRAVRPARAAVASPPATGCVATCADRSRVERAYRSVPEVETA